MVNTSLNGTLISMVSIYTLCDDMYFAYTNNDEDDLAKEMYENDS